MHATNGDTMTAARDAASRSLMAALLAVSPLLGLAAQPAYADAGGSADAPALVAGAVPDGAFGAADESGAAALVEVDWHDVLDGRSSLALERWLAGEELTAEELLSIDAGALRTVDAELADELEAAQEAALREPPAQEDAGLDGAAPARSGVVQGAAQAGGASGLAARQEAGGQGGETPEVPAEAEPPATQDAQPQAAEPGLERGTDTPYAPRKLSVSLTTVKFIAVIGEPARKLAADNDLYASVMIAQAILESASGNSGLAQAPNFNLFGIKGSYRGESVTMGTQEDDGTGSYYSIDAAFRKYPSYRESLADYADLLSGTFYAPARRSNAKDPAAACDYLQGTYATSTSYSASLQDLIETYDLTRYDAPLGYEPVEALSVPVRSEAATLLAGEPATVEERRGLVDLVAESTSRLGCPYVWGATGPDSFDCSGLVWRTYRDALGISLPRVAADQALVGEDVDFAGLHMGDLLFFTDDEGHVNHAAMYLAEGCYIESTSPGGVQVTAMEERTPAFAKRVVETKAAGARTGNKLVLKWDKPAPSAQERRLALYQELVGSEGRVEYGWL